MDDSDYAALFYIEEAKRDFYKFVYLLWPVVEPATKFKDAWHLEAICEHLQAVTRGEIKNLLINIPPGHAKSLALSVFWLPWVWLQDPSSRWIFASYALNLSIRDSIKCRDIIRSSRYQKLFRPPFKLSEDQDQKTRFNNNQKGYRIATSTGGSGTGERAGYIVCDDPLNAIDARSDVHRESSSHWWFNTMSTRDEDPVTTRRVVVMQRLHEKDLSGEIIERGGYDHLCLPAEFEPKRKCKTSIGWSDPRKAAGELLWPEVYGPEQIAAKKNALGSQGFAGQFQQAPVSADGGLFKRAWWRYYEELPMNVQRIVQFWDTAQKAGITNDYSVCATWGETPFGLFLIDVWRKKVEAPQLQQAVVSLYEKHKPSTVLIEDKSSGASLIQYLRQQTTLPVLAFNPGQRDKEVRASSATPTVESGNVFLPKGASWVEDFIDEHEKFPLGEHDDMVDTTSMAVEFFKTRKIAIPRIRSL